MKTKVLTFQRWFLDGTTDDGHGRDNEVPVLIPDDEGDVFEADVLRQFVAGAVAPYLYGSDPRLADMLASRLFYRGDGLFGFDPTGGHSGPRRGEVRIGLMVCFDEQGLDLNRPEYAFDLLWIKRGVACDDDPYALASELQR